MTDYIKRAFDYVRAECRNVRTAEEGLTDVLDVLDAAERSALGAGAKPETRTKSVWFERGSIEAEAARVNEQDGMIAFLIGVLERIRRPTSCAESIGIADRALDYVKLWNTGVWAPGARNDPAAWSASECSAFGHAWLRDVQVPSLPTDESAERLGFTSSYSDAISEFNAAARDAHRLQQEVKTGAADYAAAVAALSEIAAADPVTADDTGALTSETWLRFRDVARAARAKQTEAQAAAQRYATAVQKLSEAAIAAEPSR